MSNKIKLILLGVLFIVVGTIGLTLPFLPFYVSADFRFLDEVAAQRVNPAELAVEPATETDIVNNALVIPSINVRMPLFEGNSSNILKKGGWVFPETSTPDRGGNTVIFGHRFRYLPPLSNTFYNLDKIKEGDKFSIMWNGRDYKYKVVRIKTISPDNLAVLDATSDPIVTLITCAPLFSTAQRLVVVGERQ